MTYKEEQAELKAEQEQMTREEVHDQMKKQSEFMVELDNLPSQTHRWINRGIKLTCENGGHPYHESWLRMTR